MEKKKDDTPPKRRKRGQRARFHDYCAPGYYLITATAENGDSANRRLSRMPEVTPERLSNSEMILPILTDLGELIQKEIVCIPTYHPKLEVKRYVIMPDHIHLVIFVKERLKRKLGSELAGFFGACTRGFRELRALEANLRLFQPFHDRIIFNFNQLRRSIIYVEDNPRHYIIKKRHPYLFRRYLHVRIGDREYGMMGNIFLLKAIYLLPVRIYRRWSEKEFDGYDRKCARAIEEGAVIIPPAIHPREKAIMNMAVAGGGSVIKLIDQPLTERTKPSGLLFDLCAEGRLLLLAPWPSRDDKTEKSGYRTFHDMNDMARTIADLPVDTRMSILEILQ